MSLLAIALNSRYEYSGDEADLDAAISAGQQALAATPATHPDRVARTSNLALALTRRFERTGDRGDLDAAISAARQALAVTPDGDPIRFAVMSNLGIALRIRFEQTGDRDDLDAAVDAARQAVAAVSASHPDRAGLLSNLGIALNRRFEQDGEKADLDAAISAGQQALAATPADHRERGRMLSNLGMALHRRFERDGDRGDLDAAVDAARQAVAATPAGDPEQGKRLTNLSSDLAARFRQTGDTADLDAAIHAARQAVAATPPGDPERGGRLSNLGIALLSRFDRAGDGADLDAAIHAAQQAVALVPAAHPHRGACLSNLSGALARRLERDGDRGDLDAAITLGQQAVAATRPGSPQRSGRLNDLASVLDARYMRARDEADLDAAITALRQAVAEEVAPPSTRARAAHGWGRVAARGRRWQEAVAGFTAASGLLGLVAPRGLARGDQEHLLEQMGGLAADAAASCVHAGLKDRAVELFEQSRGILLGQALDTRTDLTALAGQHPGLAARFTALRDDLDRAVDPVVPAPAPAAGTGGVGAGGRAQAADRDWEQRQAAAAAFDQVIAEIRQLPGFGGFLRPPPVETLLEAAAQGPVVIVAVSWFGSYALILTGGGVLEPVLLPGLTPEAVYDRTAVFLAALENAGSRAAEQRLGDTLGWLWEELTGPVLDRLGIAGPPSGGQPWPRLWWCVSGLLPLLPVHAAGHHIPGDAAPATVIDRVVSSYTPTIRALAHARRPRTAATTDRGDGRPGADDRVVVVAMPRTPGASDLPGVQLEATELQRRFPGQVTVLSGAQATHDTVLAALPAARWAHFSCHGSSDPSNLSASCLLLADHEQRPLTVMDVSRLRLDDADLAFLSACSTARTGARLADEAIHLASAFQLAGYRHVIGTLWPIGDRPAVDIAAAVYATLATVGEHDVAGALHAAVRQARQRQGLNTPWAWASHIHAGA